MSRKSTFGQSGCLLHMALHYLRRLCSAYIGIREQHCVPRGKAALVTGVIRIQLGEVLCKQPVLFDSNDQQYPRPPVADRTS